MLQLLPSLRRSTQWRLGSCLALLACTAIAAVADERLTRRPEQSPLATAVDASWTGLSLRQAATRLTELSGLPIVVDRRLDPDTRFSLDAAGEPLEDVLAKLATAAGGSVAILESHARITPPGAARALAAAERLRAAELRGLDGPARKTALDRRAWAWPDGARPRDLVAAAAADTGIAIEGVDAVPHDHFPAARLPELSLAERLDLLLAHFDRRVSWKNRTPSAENKPTFAIVPIEAVAADATQPEPVKKPAAAPPRLAAEATYSLRVAAPLDELLATLAKRFGLALELDSRALEARGIAAGEIVRLTVENVSRDALLDAILDPLGLGWRIEGTRLQVGKK